MSALGGRARLRSAPIRAPLRARRYARPVRDTETHVRRIVRGRDVGEAAAYASACYRAAVAFVDPEANGWTRRLA